MKEQQFKPLYTAHYFFGIKVSCFNKLIQLRTLIVFFTGDFP